MVGLQSRASGLESQARWRQFRNFSFQNVYQELAVLLAQNVFHSLYAPFPPLWQLNCATFCIALVKEEDCEFYDLGEAVRAPASKHLLSCIYTEFILAWHHNILVQWLHSPRRLWKLKWELASIKG